MPVPDAGKLPVSVQTLPRIAILSKLNDALAHFYESQLVTRYLLPDSEQIGLQCFHFLDTE